MKKKELVRMLDHLSDEDDVVLWNGYVEDYNDIASTLTEVSLVRETEDWIYFMIKGQWCKEHGRLPSEKEDALLKEEAEVCYKENNDWDTANPYFDESRFKQAYGENVKYIYVLDGTPRGKSTWDRAGTIHY